MHIGSVNIETPLALAPMAGVTDAAFRMVCREQGAGYAVTEMVSSRAICLGDKKTAALMDISRDERPIGVQIFGSDADIMAEAAKKVAEAASPDVIDINMGCPVGKIVRSGDGSALMLDIAKAEGIVRAVASAVELPVTVKFRKGFDMGHVNAVEFARMCEGAGAAAVAVHGRTRAQMYSGTADWDIIRDVKRAVAIPVIANGDVFSAGDAARLSRYTGADMVMIGRGAMGYPWIFSEARAAISGQPVPEAPPWEARLAAAVRQMELSAEYKGERSAALEARKHLAWYLRGMPHAAFFRERVMSVETLEDIRRAAQEIIDCLRMEGRERHDQR